MKKHTAKKTTTTIPTTKTTPVVVETKKAKNTLVKPAASYTKDEVRAILRLGKGSSLSPKYCPGMGGRGKVPGTAVIAYLERSQKVKVGRRYKSGTVTVVAR